MNLEFKHSAKVGNFQPLSKVARNVVNYSQILDDHILPHKTVGYYLQVGEIIKVQGWILHISVVRSQLVEMLDLLIPFLKSHRVSFKVAQDNDTARSILDGDFGHSQVGKVITVYPVSNEEAISIAKELIILTEPFKGPAILTDIHLGGNVYTRYGGFNPVIMSDTYGKKVKYIYDSMGNLIADSYAIPFTMPLGIEWPFSVIKPPSIPPSSKILHGIYRPLSLLKSDAKGDVIKAIYLRNLFRVKPCVIKQGNKNMWSDNEGRDIIDRLIWQEELHDILVDTVPLPKILDAYVEDGNMYLAMEYIKGRSLHNLVTELNYKCQTWEQIPIKIKMVILDHILTLSRILEQMHQKGYIHRDVTPVNFLVDKRNRLYCIDIELAYSIGGKRPNPPFEFGTHGFMSPEQMEVQNPTFKEDIYGLGATMITLLVGLPASAFSTINRELLRENLYFFIGNKVMAEMISSCLEFDPAARPTISQIFQAVKLYMDELKNRKTSIPTVSSAVKINEHLLQLIINGAIKGLSNSPTLIHNDLWQFKVNHPDNIPDSLRREFGKSGGLAEGISGVIYFIGRAKQTGYDISACHKAFNKGWEYVKNHCLQELPNIAAGLYGGASGMALAIKSGIASGLIENVEENRDYLQQCLELPTSGLDLATGAAGKGIAILQCESFFTKEHSYQLLQNCVNTILSNRHKNGSWILLKDQSGKRTPAASLSFGNSGIIWFLLEYAARFDDKVVLEVAKKALKLLHEMVMPFIRFIEKKGFRKIIENPRTCDGIQGIILVFIKAYSTLQDTTYKDLAEELLMNYPASLVHENFSQAVGLSGMGELYLEAFQVFKNNEWQRRADWIAMFFMHTSRKETDGSYHWLSNNSAYPTADLLVGNGGIIHFLIRHITKGKLGYRLLG